MKINGYIQFQNKVSADGQDCYGCARASGNTFSVRIAKDAGANFELFAETIIHELIHIWIFVLMAITRFSATEAQQHKMMDRGIKVLVRDVMKHYKEKCS